MAVISNNNILFGWNSVVMSWNYGIVFVEDMLETKKDLFILWRESE